jgi:hypothetical protein
MPFPLGPLVIREDSHATDRRFDSKSSANHGAGLLTLPLLTVLLHHFVKDMGVFSAHQNGSCLHAALSASSAIEPASLHAPVVVVGVHRRTGGEGIARGVVGVGAAECAGVALSLFEVPLTVYVLALVPVWLERLPFASYVYPIAVPVLVAELRRSRVS